MCVSWMNEYWYSTEGYYNSFVFLEGKQFSFFKNKLAHTERYEAQNQCLAVKNCFKMFNDVT